SHVWISGLRHVALPFAFGILARKDALVARRGEGVKLVRVTGLRPLRDQNVTFAEKLRYRYLSSAAPRSSRAAFLNAKPRHSRTPLRPDGEGGGTTFDPRGSWGEASTTRQSVLPLEPDSSLRRRN